MNKKHFNTIIFTTTVIVIVILIVIIVGICIPERAEVIQGQAETSDYRISSKIAGRVMEIRVQEGDSVHRGDTLVILEAPDIEAKLSQAIAAFEAAQAQSTKAMNGSRQEQIQTAYEQWQRAVAGLDIAERTYNRVERLFNSGVVAEQKRDEAYAQYMASQATERAARSQYDMAVNGSRSEDLTAADAQVARACSVINEVSSYIDETVLTASADGIVTEIFPELGELVGGGAPIMNVAMTGKSYFVFNVREDFLPGLTVGTEVNVYMPVFDREVAVRITRIKEVGSFAAWKATKALDEYDLKTFEVRAYPVDSNDLKDVRAGMSAILKI